MKKRFALILVVLFVAVLFSFSACQKDDVEELRIVMPDGTPALAVAKLINDNSKLNGQKIKVDIVSPALIGTEVARGTAQFAILPTNAAANIIKNNGGYKFASVNIFGVLYIIGKEVTEQSFSVNDLERKRVASIGFSNTPQFLFEKILDESGIGFEHTIAKPSADNVSINYVADGAAVIAALETGAADFGLLGEPAVTASQNKGYSIAFDLQLGFSKLNLYPSEREDYPQASLIVKDSFAKSNSDVVEELLKVVKDNVVWIRESENLSRITDVLASAGSGAAFPPASIPRCNVGFERASDMKEEIKIYLKELYGITIDDDAFYVAK